jgi:PAS domain-containing protein
MSIRHKVSAALAPLLRSLAGVRTPPSHRSAKTQPDHDAATMMEKLDAALNNMSHGLCMFGPDDRLLLWNDRYVKMYKIAPGRLFVGCTLEQMLPGKRKNPLRWRGRGLRPSTRLSLTRRAAFCRSCP